MALDSVAARLSTQGVAYAAQIAAAARRHGVDPELLAAVAAQETGGPGSNAGPNVVGDGGHGRGVFQIDDRWHAFATTPAAMDPAKNADYAAGMLHDLLGQYGGDAHRALSAYNAGSPDARGTTTRWGDGRSLGYADSVLRHYRDLTGHGAETQTDETPQSSAIAERQTTVARTALLQNVAQQLPPLRPPSLPPLHHEREYHRQSTDYLSLTTNDTDNNAT
jgi:hypothetical protein